MTGSHATHMFSSDNGHEIPPPSSATSANLFWCDRLVNIKSLCGNTTQNASIAVQIRPQRWQAPIGHYGRKIRKNGKTKEEVCRTNARGAFCHLRRRGPFVRGYVDKRTFWKSVHARRWYVQDNSCCWRRRSHGKSCNRGIS